jgi:drug/metabolite transporter (DMT)-like permease
MLAADVRGERMSLRGILAYGCFAVFWALLFVGAAVGVHDLGVGITAGVLAVTAALGLLALARLAGRRLVWRIDWGKAVAGALVAAVGLGGILFAMDRIGVALTAFVVSAMPLFGNVGAQLRGRARVTGPTAVGLGLGLLGLYLVAVSPVGEPSWRFIAGILYAVSAAVVGGVSGRWLGDLVELDRAVEHSVVGLLIAAGALFCVAPFTPPMGNPWSVVLVAVLGLGCGLLLLIATSELATTISKRSAVTLPGVGMVLAALGGVLLLGEQVSAPEWVGAVLILAGTALLSEPLLALLPSSWRN